MNKPSPGGIAAKLRSALARLPELWPALFRSATSPNPIDIGQILLTSNGNYMAVVDRDYTYRWVNDGYLNLFNQGRDDIVGHSIAEIFGKEVFETTIRPDMDRCLAGEQVKIDDWRDLPNGRRFFNVILSPYYAEAGHVEWVIVDAHDISDRKRAQQELQDSEERFQLAVRGTNDGLWDWNIKNNQSWWSPRLYELLGYTDGEIEAGYEHFMERVHPDDQGRTHDAIRAHHQQQIPYDIEHRVQTKSGAYRWFRRRGQAVWDNQGKPVRMAGSMCDIHERKAAEAQLDLYRHIVSSTSNFLSYIDRDLIYREVNDAYLQAFGKIRDQIVGCHAQQLFGKEAFEGGIKDYMQQCLGGAAVNYELRLDFPNRGKRLLVVHYDPHRGDDGQVQGIVVSAVDITERKRAEEALRKSDERLRCFFDAGLVGMAITSPDKEWVQFNQTFCDITGYSREELLQMTWVDITHPDDVVSNVALLDQARAGVIDGYSIEKRFLRKDGKTVYAALSTECVRREDGSLDYIIALFQDITERKQTETAMATLQHQLLQSQKMEAIGQLTGGIAHDFNNILASILGYTDLVLKRCVREGEDKLKEFLMEIKIGGERARDLVTQMLTYSRAMPSNVRPQSLPPLVEQALGLLRPSLPASIDLHTQFAADLPPVRVDAAQFGQLLMNLCINARDAMDGRGVIDLQLGQTSEHGSECAACHESVSGEFVVLAVRDSGSGIPADAQATVFDPFFTTKEVGQGTGLGLSMVHGIMHECGGHILVQSGPAGTTFRLLFPVPEDPARETAPRAQVEGAVPEPGQGVILVVDDEHSVTRYLGELLADQGYDPRVLNDSGAALESFRQAPDGIDLVITDQTMPGLTGLELAREMLSLRPDLPIILTSGHSDQVDGTIARGMGIRAWFKKPFDGDILLSKVHELLKEKAQRLINDRKKSKRVTRG